jgi:hypothetical protein
VISNFVNGIWSGPITFNEPGAPLTFRATDSRAFTGSSVPFAVIWRDSDGDGMPDEWEAANKLDPLDPSDASLDPDADGLTNLQEFQAGTNPRDPDSTLKILSVSWRGTNAVAVSFASVTNRHYQIEAATDLTGTTWAPASALQAGTGSILVLTNLVNRLDHARFLRLRAGF